MTDLDDQDDPALRDADIDLLSAYFTDPELGDDVMTLPELDGFLTALAIGPEPIPSDEWLPIIWNGGEPLFRDDAQAQAVLRAIASRSDDIVHGLRDGSYGPLMDVDADDRPLPQSWALGFMTGASLRQEAWTKLFESEDDDAIAYPILALCEDEEGKPLFDLSARDRKFLIANAPEMIAGAVADIADYWKRVPTLAPQTPVRTGPKTGRNDPCPCGSGKKYKKCCSS
jgi:uncharacterized protein